MIFPTTMALLVMIISIVAMYLFIHAMITVVCHIVDWCKLVYYFVSDEDYDICEYPDAEPLL